MYYTRVPDDMAAKTGRVEDVEKVQVDGLVSKMASCTYMCGVIWMEGNCVCVRECVILHGQNHL